MNPRTIEAAGRPTRVHHVPGEGPPVVLLHGASGTAATWAPTLGAWSAHELWIPDLPGRGVHAEPLDRVPALAAWLADVIVWTAGPGATVVGHSLGGAVGLQLALERPELLRRLVMVCSSARLRVAPAILDLVAATSARVPLDFAFAFGPHTARAVIDRYQADARGVPTATALADWRACDAFDLRDQLHRIQVDTRVVYGTVDPLIPEKHQRRLAETLPHARAVAVPGAGHMVPWEAPERLVAAVTMPDGPPAPPRG
jgi:pimeloyl-ACP methyl ester carboxylesterase